MLDRAVFQETITEFQGFSSKKYDKISLECIYEIVKYMQSKDFKLFITYSRMAQPTSIMGLPNPQYFKEKLGDWYTDKNTNPSETEKDEDYPCSYCFQTGLLECALKSDDLGNVESYKHHFLCSCRNTYKQSGSDLSPLTPDHLVKYVTVSNLINKEFQSNYRLYMKHLEKIECIKHGFDPDKSFISQIANIPVEKTNNTDKKSLAKT